jgi:AcrR family transcriptional regulator
MTETTWQRARQPEQKRKRRQDILDAAATLFDQHGFDAVSLNAIARQAQIAKSNIYRYFEGREDIFMSLLASDEADWVAALERTLAPLASSDDVEAVGVAIAAAAAERPRLCALTAVLSSVIEQSISAEAFIRFKTGVAQLSLRIANALHAALPSFPYERAGEFLRYLQALAAGLWPMANLPAPLICVLENPDFADMRTNFEADFGNGVTALLRGLCAQPR